VVSLRSAMVRATDSASASASPSCVSVAAWVELLLLRANQRAILAAFGRAQQPLLSGIC
jgi:hypothetical protein